MKANNMTYEEASDRVTPYIYADYTFYPRNKSNMSDNLPMRIGVRNQIANIDSFISNILKLKEDSILCEYEWHEEEKLCLTTGKFNPLCSEYMVNPLLNKSILLSNLDKYYIDPGSVIVYGEFTVYESLLNKIYESIKEIFPRERALVD